MIWSSEIPILQSAGMVLAYGTSANAGGKNLGGFSRE